MSEITELSKDEILELTNKLGAYEFGRQKDYREGFANGCKAGERKANEKKHSEKEPKNDTK